MIDKSVRKCRKCGKSMKKECLKFGILENGGIFAVHFA